MHNNFPVHMISNSSDANNERASLTFELKQIMRKLNELTICSVYDIVRSR